jgi:hypothetical protein
MGDQPPRARPANPVNDNYNYHGSGDDTSYAADAARNEIWHVYAKEGQTVAINRDDPRSQDVIKHDEGGRFRMVSEHEFTNRGGRIGINPRTGEPYPPYVWQSHRNVEPYYRTRSQDVGIIIDAGGHGSRHRGPIYRDRDCDDGYRHRPPIYRDRDCDDGYRHRPPIYRDRHGGWGRNRGGALEIRVGGIEVGESGIRIGGGVRIPIGNRRYR